MQTGRNLTLNTFKRKYVIEWEANGDSRSNRNRQHSTTTSPVSTKPSPTSCRPSPSVFSLSLSFFTFIYNSESLLLIGTDELPWDRGTIQHTPQTLRLFTSSSQCLFRQRHSAAIVGRRTNCRLVSHVCVSPSMSFRIYLTLIFISVYFKRWSGYVDQNQ